MSVIAGVTLWNFYFQIFERTIKSEQIIEFLKHLLRYISGDILLIWDRLPAHRSLITQQFIRDQKGRLAMEYLPPYAPELNPVERIWLFLKEKFLSHRLLDDYEAILNAAAAAWNRMVSEPGRLTSLCSYPWIINCVSS